MGKDPLIIHLSVLQYLQRKLKSFYFNDRIIFVPFTLCSFMYKESIRPIETRFMVLLKLSFRRSTFILQLSVQIMVYSHVLKRPTLFYATHYPTFYVFQMIGHKTALHNIIVVQIWKVKTFTSCIRSTCKRYIYSDDQIVLFEETIQAQLKNTSKRIASK